MTDAVDIQNIDFSYKGSESTLIHNLNLQIKKGDRFGIFGPNGAGKTTLLSLMTGLLPYPSGSIQLLGYEIKANRNKVKTLFGFVPQDLSFYPELTPAENMEFFGAWAGLNKKQIQDRIEELLSVLSLTNVRNTPVKNFSGGMKRRINLAIAVMHEPEILFLDEPTVGVDVQTRYAVMEYLKLLNKKGTTLVYTSHHLKEAEDLCNTIAMIDEGKIIVHDSLQNLLKNYEQDGLEGLFLHLTGRAYRD